jgi:hypothetical protein
LDADELALFEKMNALFFLGKLVGLPTLKSILTKLDISSNRLQQNYTKFYKNLTVNKLRVVFEFIFEYQVTAILTKMDSRDPTIWSKKRVTAILDDSIFRQ